MRQFLSSVMLFICAPLLVPMPIYGQAAPKGPGIYLKNDGAWQQLEQLNMSGTNGTSMAKAMLPFSKVREKTIYPGAYAPVATTT